MILKLKTRIHAPAEICFNLSRDIDLHQRTMKKSRERAIAGMTTGLMGLDETVTWKAHHFGIVMKMTIKITELDYPVCFTDEMLKGPFQKLKHKHVFYQYPGHTLMIDEFEFASTLGIIGKIVDAIFLGRYMRNLLTQRNAEIKKIAEEIADTETLPVKLN